MISVVCCSVYFLIQGQKVKTTLLLNVTRDSASPRTTEYTYDDFYRLQADERFADTIVQWIKSPYIQAQDKHVLGKITAKRLSSQVIEVHYVTRSREKAEIVAGDLIDVINDESHKLNSKQEQTHWFIVQGSAPAITDGRLSLSFLVILGMAVGSFVAFWTVLIRHYVLGVQN